MERTISKNIKNHYEFVKKEFIKRTKAGKFTHFINMIE